VGVVDSRVVTRYELLDRIGVGGMAEIFRGKAVAAGGFEKPVAIKRILPHLSQDKRFVELLIAEAKVLSLLKHRNIVQIFDVGLGDDGQYFLVMEYVDGKDLGAVQRGIEVRRRRVPFDLALHIGAEICEALEHAHSARAPDGKPMSLVHRDISPSNVLLSRAGEVKLTDFGIAKRAEQEATGHGAIRGKFAYISPEQARNEHLDPRSDVFSVGILLWELITNRRLFSGLGDMEALRGVREVQVPRPREIDGRLSSEIDTLIMSTLTRDVRSRPTAGQLGAKLRTLRYSLDVAVGDPATELAKIIDTAEEVERQSSQQLMQTPPRLEFDGEATVIRIHTADEFSKRDKDGMSVARARQVIDRFEEEETRQAQLSRDQMAFLRSNAGQDSTELTPLPGVHTRPDGDERTRARAPLSLADFSVFSPGTIDADGDEATLLLTPSTRRTPVPPAQSVPSPRPVTQSTPTPGQRSPDLTADPLGPTPAPPRSGRGVAHTTPRPRSGSAPDPVPPVVQPVLPPPLAPPPLAGPLPMAPTAPPMTLAPPPPISPPNLQPPPGNYAGWGMPPQPPMGGAAPIMPNMQGMPGMPGMPGAPGMYERPVVQRPATQVVPGLGKHRRTQLQPWMLVVGALIMALLAFAVTRACIHTTSKPAAETK
jgi:serine/threonine protein kinase